MGKVSRRYRNADISQVESGLDAIRTEQQTSGGLISEKPNEALFEINRTGNYPGSHTAAKRGRRELKLTVDEILKPKSHIDAPAQRKRAVKDEAILRKKAKSIKARIEKPIQTNQSKDSYDLWNEPKKDSNPEPKLIKRQIQMAEPEVKNVPAVRVPHPGASYNPDLEKHRNLLEKALDVEMKRINLVEKYRAEVAPIFTSKGNPDSALTCINGESDREEGGHDDAFNPNSGIKMEDLKLMEVASGKKKSEKDRKRKEKEKMEARNRLEQKIRNEQMVQLTHLRTIAKKVKEEMKQAQEKCQLNKMRKGRVKVGPYQFNPSLIEVKLSEELLPRPKEIVDGNGSKVDSNVVNTENNSTTGIGSIGSWRKFVPEGNLLVDRFKSLQERTLIEPRIKVKVRRKFRLKEYEKHTYKRFK